MRRTVEGVALHIAVEGELRTGPQVVQASVHKAAGVAERHTDPGEARRIVEEEEEEEVAGTRHTEVVPEEGMANLLVGDISPAGAADSRLAAEDIDQEGERRTGPAEDIGPAEADIGQEADIVDRNLAEAALRGLLASGSIGQQTQPT